MIQHHKHATTRICVGLLTALLTGGALLGCSTKSVDVAPPTIETARPAVSPPTSVAPAGTVRPLTGRPLAAAVAPGARALLVLTAGTDQAPSVLTVLPTGGGPTRTVVLPGPASSLVSDGGTTAYLASRGSYLTVDVEAGTAARVDVSGQPDTEFTAIARRADGRLVLGSADGAVYILAAPSHHASAVEHRTEIFARVDSLVTQGNTTVVLDRGQTSVTSVAADGSAQQALRAGEGATSMAVDPVGRVLVTDTRGDELLVYGVDPLILRQRYPVPEAPYGVVGSPELAWVSQTADNVVVGYDLSTGIPVEKVRYPTVQQPDILAFDDEAGTLYAVSGSGAGVQAISDAGARR